MGKSWNLLRKRLAQELEPFDSVSEFCRKTGFSRTAVDKWLNNQSIPNLEHIDRIADALGYQPHELIKERGLPIPKPHTISDCYECIGKALGLTDDNDHFLKVAEPSDK